MVDAHSLQASLSSWSVVFKAPVSWYWPPPFTFVSPSARSRAPQGFQPPAQVIIQQALRRIRGREGVCGC